jgi:YD repeat-containing protein
MKEHEKMNLKLKRWLMLGSGVALAWGLVALCVLPLTAYAQEAPSANLVQNVAASTMPATTPTTPTLQDTATFSQSGVVLAELYVRHERFTDTVPTGPLVYIGAGERIIWENSLASPTDTLALIGYVTAGSPNAWRLGPDMDDNYCQVGYTDGLRQYWACHVDEWSYVDVVAYVVPLPACDEGCGICQCSTGEAADPVDTWSGAFSHRETDFALPTLGPELTFERTYNSARYADLGVLGYGWTHPYAASLIISDTHVIFHAPRASVLTYTRTSPTTFLPAPNVRAELGIVGSGYVLTTTDRTRYIFDAAGRLTELRDANDNALTLTYTGAQLTGLRDAAGRGLTLNYADFATGPGVTTTLLTRVSDPLGRSVHYGYARDGAYTVPLLNVLTDTRGFTHTYTYADTTVPLLLSATDAAGHSVFTNAYGPGYTAAQPYAVRVQTDTTGSVTRITYAAAGETYVATITDARGHSTQHVYDAAGVLVQVVDAAGAPWSTQRDLYVNLAQVTDPLSRTTRAEWAANGCAPAVLTDTLGHVTQMRYNAACQPTQTVNAQGYTTTYQYVGENLAAVTDALGGVVAHTYDPRGLLLQTVNHGLTTTYGYDTFGQRIAITDTQGRVTTYGYDLAGRLITTTAPNGLATLNVYDAGDNLIQVTRNYTPAGGQNYLDTYNLVTQYDYDALGNQIAVTDTVGRVTRSWYDAAGRLLRMTSNYTPTLLPNHAGQWNLTTVYGYDALGNQVAVTDTVGRVTRRWYDAQNRVVRVTVNYSPTLPANHAGQWNLTTEYGYDGVGNQTHVTDALGHVTVTEYDDLNRRIAVIDPQGHTTHYGYDALGHQVVVTDADGITKYSAYDALGRVVATRDALGHTTRYSYNAQGRQTTVVDANGVARHSEYDAWGRQVGNVANYDPTAPPDQQTNVTTRYGYDALGRRAVITDANGHATRSVYNDVGQWVAEIDPLGHTTAYGYDVLGNRTVITAADGSVTTYHYDALNRLVEIRYPDAHIAYAYDVLGNRTAMTDTTGVTTYVYDARSRLITTTNPTTGTVGYRYDALGRRTHVIYPSGDTVQYTYTPAGQQHTVTDWSGGVTVYTYTAAGRLAERRLPNGVITRHRYDRAGRLIELTHRNAAGKLLARYGYTLDALGNRIQVQEGSLYQIYLPLVLRTGGIVVRAGETTANQETTAATARLISYYYDPLNRLVAADYSTGERFAYHYDAAGNRLTLTETTPLSGTVISTHTYDAAHRLRERHVSDGRSYTYTWAARGQLLAEHALSVVEGNTQGYAVRTFGYNGAGQMAEATVFTLTTQFSYNGAGGRVWVNVVGHGATHVTLDVGGQRVLAETTPTDTVQYLYGDDCLGEYRDGAWLYYLNDGSGYVRQGVNDQGEVVSSWLFDPSGMVLEGPEGPVSHLICGGVYDWSTGLLYKGGNYFDPRLGIWLLVPLAVITWRSKRGKSSLVRTLSILFCLAGVSLVACVGEEHFKDELARHCITFPTPGVVNAPLNECTALPTSGSEPTYNPNEWGDCWTTQYCNNCYSYALNQKSSCTWEEIRAGTQDHLHPGEFSGHPYFYGATVDVDILKATTCDNIISTIAEYDGYYVWDCERQCRHGYYKIALFIDPYNESISGDIADYHFYRQDAGGCWSHKPNVLPATNLDANGSIIEDPRLPSVNHDYTPHGSANYTEFCDCFCVPVQ